MGQLLIFFQDVQFQDVRFTVSSFFSYFNLTFIKFFLERFVLLFVFADYLINFFVIVFTSSFKYLPNQFTRIKKEDYYDVICEWSQKCLGLSNITKLNI